MTSNPLDFEHRLEDMHCSLMAATYEARAYKAAYDRVVTAARALVDAYAGGASQSTVEGCLTDLEESISCEQCLESPCRCP